MKIAKNEKKVDELTWHNGHFGYLIVYPENKALVGSIHFYTIIGGGGHAYHHSELLLSSLADYKQMIEAITIPERK